jgi:hypothetical protein
MVAKLSADVDIKMIKSYTIYKVTRRFDENVSLEVLLEIDEEPTLY